MADASHSFTELRFIVGPERTEVYVYLDVKGDMPIGVEGWHHASFPATTSTVQWLDGGGLEDVLEWECKPPPGRLNHPPGCGCAPCGDLRFQVMERLGKQLRLELN